MNLKINARCEHEDDLSEDDQCVPGQYHVNFGIDARGIPEAKLASMALDIFHAHIPVHNLDSFSFTVHDENDRLIEEDPSHESYSHRSGYVEKFSDESLPIDYVTIPDSSHEAIVVTKRPRP